MWSMEFCIMRLLQSDGHLQSNGLVEWQNGTLKAMLSKVVSKAAINA